MNRKEFVKTTAMVAAAIAVPGRNLFATVANTNVRIALLGAGLRGQNHLELLLRRNDIDVVAICDVDERMLTSAKEMISKTGKKMPQIYTGDQYAWKRLLEKEKLDAVIIASPWE